MRIDTSGLLARADLVELVGARVELKRRGREYVGLCPFHTESTASFSVIPHKGFYHCFGCGAHGNAIGWLMETEALSFREACERLGARDYAARRDLPAPAPSKRADEDVRWVPITPVPHGAAPLVADDGTVTAWNPKRGRWSTFRPARVDVYRDARGAMLGAVLRVEFADRDTGKRVKITPTITWCVAPDGAQAWCMRPFEMRRPLYGLDDLAAKPEAPVLVPEGEKCRVAGAGAWEQYAVVSWPGGSKGVAYADWSALAGRDVVLWPDADQAGREAMLGWVDRSGLLHPGVAQLVAAAGARSIRYVDVSGMPDGWDIADALDPARDGWSAKQLAAWASVRVRDVEVQVDEALDTV